MAQQKLTAKTVKSLTPPPVRHELRDTVLPGFGLRYWRSSRDPRRVDGSWFVTFRYPGRTRLVRHTIGPLSRYSLSQAREQARELL